MNPNEKTFCVGAWNELRILPNGSLNYCEKAVIPGPGERGFSDNIVDTDIDSYFHGPTVSAVRQEIMQGLQTPLCSSCYNDEKTITFSHRRRHNLKMAIFPGNNFSKSLTESGFFERLDSTKSKPRFYNVSFSNLCNLACVMCSEDWSSRLASEFGRLGIRRSKHPDYYRSALLDWSQDDQIWGRFMDHVMANKEIVCFHFQGGEPFLHRRVQEFVDQCVKAGHTDFHFTTVTNGTMYDEKFIEQLKHFKSVQIEISIETLAKSNDYVRWPSSHTSVMSNIKKFLTHRSKKFDVVIRTVPQVLTVLDYDTLLQMCLDHDVVVDSNIINYPRSFLPCVLSADLKHQAAQRLQTWIDKHHRTSQQRDQVFQVNLRNNAFVDQNLLNNAKLVLASLAQPEPADIGQLRCDLKDYLQKIDQSRKHHLKDFIPEIADWLYV